MKYLNTKSGRFVIAGIAVAFLMAYVVPLQSSTRAQVSGGNNPYAVIGGTGGGTIYQSHNIASSNGGTNVGPITVGLFGQQQHRQGGYDPSLMGTRSTTTPITTPPSTTTPQSVTASHNIVQQQNNGGQVQFGPGGSAARGSGATATTVGPIGLNNIQLGQLRVGSSPSTP